MADDPALRNKTSDGKIRWPRRDKEKQQAKLYERVQNGSNEIVSPTRLEERDRKPKTSAELSLEDYTDRMEDAHSELREINTRSAEGEK